MEIEKLIISDQAVVDLEQIWQHIGIDSPAAADMQIQAIYETCLLIKENPEIGKTRDELLSGIRCLPVKKYLIFYRIKNKAIQIVRILSGYRDLDSIF
jgi:toxin ParE1/3/4